jgi:hypothetical protein
VQLCLLIYLPTRPCTGVCFTLLSFLQFEIRLAYCISWSTPFWLVRTQNQRLRYQTELRALIPSAKWLDMPIELIMAVTDNVVFILEANRPETRRNSEEWETIPTWNRNVLFHSWARWARATSRHLSTRNSADWTSPHSRSKDAG